MGLAAAKETITRRERVLSAVRHEPLDKLPFQLDLTDETHARLALYFNDDDFFEKTGSHLAIERNEEFTAQPHGRVRDMFGVIWDRRHGGDFGVVEQYLLPDAALSGYTFPAPNEKLIREKCQRLMCRKEEQFTLYTIGFSLFERAWTLRSMPELLMDFLVNQEFAHELLERITEYNLAVMDIVSQYDIDAFFFGDDWGQQKGLIMGPPLWREFIKPRLKKMYDKAKANGMYVCQHSCGDVSELFPDLIELGLDIYNTFQPEIYDVAAIKKLYGDKLTFYGGVSTQRLLSCAKPDAVKREMRKLMAELGAGGGYIVAPTHAMPNDIPIDNILAFLEVVQNQ